ncbi:MAG: sigma 54-interacting transcriptional regulator [Planctomycetes bacterium]|nr:sigma 54-interacting transcriptional regulator [Planctomycetota bacterium]
MTEFQVPMVAAAITVDADLADWPADATVISLERNEQLFGGTPWRGPADSSGRFLLAYDSNHLFVGGTVVDDHPEVDSTLAWDQTDCLELTVGFGADEREAGPVRADDDRILLAPLRSARPWAVVGAGSFSAQRQSGSHWTGLEVVSRRRDASSFDFECAIPFHHFRSARPGCRLLGFNLALNDRRDDAAAPSTTLTWNGRDPRAAGGLESLRLQGNGVLARPAAGIPLLSPEVVADLPWLCIPFGAMVLLWLSSRSWSWVRPRSRRLRRALVFVAAAGFALGWWLPAVYARWQQGDLWRRADQQRSLLAATIGQLEAGTLASYRGQSRDRALIDLLAGNAITRQKITSYRTLADVVGDAFGPPTREYPEDFPVRPVWLPLPAHRTETLHFDPPLQGEALYLVLGRPFVPSVPFVTDPTDVVAVEVEQVCVGQAESIVQRLELAAEFLPGGPLGRDGHEVASRRVALQGELRTLGLRVSAGAEISLAGLSLLPRRGEAARPLSLGAPSLGGVMTDLRGPHPHDAGLELGANATARIEIPPGQDLGSKVWLFYRATWPGVPVANPGARVGEVVLHFRGGVPARTIVLEHQVSMFYELLVQNTRDRPPPGSPASIAISWVDDTQEQHINMVYPVLDLPPNVEFEAIEFRNLADYRMRFRSVVFGAEKAAAPQDPDDSPLLRDGQDRRLRPDLVTEHADALVTIHREGRLSLASVAPERCQDLKIMPRVALAPGPDGRVASADLPDGSRRLTVFEPLTGDGWDGAVLGVSLSDPHWARGRAWASRVGLALCLLATPFLLLALTELLTAVANLRLRLISVLTVASLAPLLLLSFWLAQSMERGHAANQRDALRQQVRSALQQLDGQKAALHESAGQWRQDLATLVQTRTNGVADAQLGEAVAAAMPELTKLLNGQLPPEWRGGFLQLEWRPGDGVAGRTWTVTAGNERMAAAEAVARPEPSVLLHWGQVLIGVRSEQAVRGGSLALTVGRPLGQDFLAALAPGRAILLADIKGYPLAGADTPEAQRLFWSGRDHAVMAARERAALDAIERRQPVVDRSTDGVDGVLCGYGVLTDLQDTPRALLVLAAPDQRAAFDLPFGRLSVRAFFLLVAGLLAVLAAFVAFVVSGRISRPIERLERGAQALSRGELDVRVPVDEPGQIGRLSSTFNAMAADLQARLQDLQQLNRTIQELSAQLDPQHTLAVLRRFCEQHAAADRVAVLMLAAGASEPRLVLQPDGEAPVVAELAFLVRAVGASSLWVPPGGLPWLARYLPGMRAAVAIPLVYADRGRGAVLLLFEAQKAPAVDLALLGTVAAQAAVALENADLYQHAIQDPITGAFTAEYFRWRTADEVSIAQQRGQPLVLAAAMLGDGLRRPRGLRRFAALLHEIVGPGAVLCHQGAGGFQLAARGLDREAGSALLQRIATAWRAIVDAAAEGEVDERPLATALVAFPEEAASAEFLFDAVRERLQSSDPVGAAAFESDATLQAAGVTAVSPAMREVWRTLRRVAGSDLTVLLEGETGTGKEVLTNLLHRWSRRAPGPLVKVHCAALSETLLASELFGHEKGAFTGADRRKIGKFEQANGGTLFLDEVGEIPLDVQVKLLRVLQEREVDRVGGATPVPVDVRVVAATHRDLAQMVRDGAFREDLYYRLQGILVRVPPLRERRQEIPALVEAFLRELRGAGQSQVKGFSTDAMDELFRREWPGNVRELRNAVFRAVVLATGETVQLRDLMAAAPAGPGVPGGAPLVPAVLATAPMAPVPVPGVAVPPTPTLSAPVGDQPGQAAPDAPAIAVQRDAPESTESAVILPAPPKASAGADAHPPVDARSLPPRLRQLYDWLVQRGALGTQEHMEVNGVSARTALRDMMALVDAGLVVRVGSRRGARYRPVGPVAEFGNSPT